MKLLTPIVFIIASLGIFFWYIDPTYHTILSLQSDANQYQTALKSAQLAATNSSNLTSQLNSVSSDTLDRLQTALPDTIDPIHLFIDINALAQKYGASISNITIPAVAAQSSIANTRSNSQNGLSSLTTSVPLTFSVSLTYTNFLSFLQDLEKSLQLMDVSVVQFTPNDAGIYDYTITVKSYALKN